MNPTAPAPPLAEASAQARSMAAQQTIAVIGDAWTLRILRSVFRGKRRHGDFVSAFGVSRAVLSDRLGKLVAHQVLERVVQQGRHPEYRLTPRGLDLWSLFLAMWQWEMDWGSAQDPDTWAPDLPRARLSHTGCGHAMRPVLRCMACQAPVLPRAAVPMATPAAAHMANTLTLATVSTIAVRNARAGPIEPIAVIHLGWCAER